MNDTNFLDTLLEVTEVPSTESKGDFSDVIQTVFDSLDDTLTGASEDGAPVSDNSSEENVD